MALANFYEFATDNFVEGQTRVLYTKLSNGTLTDQTIPGKIPDVIATETPYSPVQATGDSGWYDLGALTAPAEFSQSPSSNAVKIQQQIAAVKMIASEVKDTVKFTVAELNQTAIKQIIHNAGAATSVSSGSGYVASTLLPFGQFTDLAEYRFAIISPLVSEAGAVTESTGGVRPRLQMLFCNRCVLDATATTMTYALGEIVAADLTFALLAEPGVDQNTELGGYITESAGTISD